MIDFFKSLFDNFKSRFKSPLIGSFAIAWLVVNFQPILILIYDQSSMKERLAYINLYYINDFWYYIVLPLFIAFFYTIILPYLNLEIDKMLKISNTNKKARIKENRIMEIDDMIDIAKKEIELENERSSYKEKSDLNNQIKKLKEDNSLLKTSSERELDIVKSELTAIKKKFDPSLIKSMDLLKSEYSQNKTALKQARTDLYVLRQEVLSPFLPDLETVYYLSGKTFDLQLDIILNKILNLSNKQRQTLLNLATKFGNGEFLNNMPEFNEEQIMIKETNLLQKFDLTNSNIKSLLAIAQVYRVCLNEYNNVWA